MIALLLRVLGHQHARPVRRTIALMAITAVTEGLSYALVVPVLTALFGPDPAGAWPWLGGFAVAVAGYAILRYLSDLPDSGWAPRCCAVSTTASATTSPDCPSAGTPAAGSARCRRWPVAGYWTR